MEYVSLTSLKAWHKERADSLMAEGEALAAEHDLGTIVWDDAGEMIANIDAETLQNNPRLVYELGVLAGKKASSDELYKVIPTLPSHRM